VASFTPSTTTASVGQAVTFTDTSSNNPTAWFWDFNDGGTATTKTASHPFQKVGTFHVKLTVSNTAGTDSTTRDLTVKAPTVTITGHVLTGGSIAIRGDGNRNVVAINNAGEKAATAIIDSKGFFQLVVPTGTYELHAVIPYLQRFLDTLGNPVEDVRFAQAISAPRQFSADAVQDVSLPNPLVLLHGYASSPDTWGTWPPTSTTKDSWIATITAHEPGQIMLAPRYAWAANPEPAADEFYTDLQGYFNDLFVATPNYDIVAHSKGGLVARVFLHKYHGYPLADHAGSLVLLGTPNSGVECALGDTQGFDFCTIRALNLQYPDFGTLDNSKVQVVAGTKSQLSLPVGLPCLGRTVPNDGIVPVDSVFTITRGDAANASLSVLSGFVVPVNHLELTETPWLTLYVYDHLGKPFVACPTPKYEPATVVSCQSSPAPIRYCLDGRGYAADGTCNVLDATSASAVKLQWTINGSTLHLDGSIGTASGCSTAAALADVTAADTAIDGFQIYRSFTPNFVPSAQTRIAYVGPATTTFLDRVSVAIPLYYAVTAVHDTVDAIVSNIVPVTLPARHRAVAPSAPNALTLLAPGTPAAPGAVITTKTPTFTWMPGPGALAYSLYIEQEGNGGYVRVFDTDLRGLTLTGTSYTLPDNWLTRTYRYRWLARAKTSAGWGPYAAPLYFTVADAGQPDLTVSNVRVTPTSVAPGGIVTVTYDAGNIGEGLAGATTTQVRLGTSSTSTSPTDIVLASTPLFALVGGSQGGGSSGGVLIPTSTPPGTYYVWVVMDATHVLQQVSTTNDTARSGAIIVDARVPRPSG
jgi:PKD repeat protein